MRIIEMIEIMNHQPDRLRIVFRQIELAGDTLLMLFRGADFK
jgi:hypothetical protein